MESESDSKLAFHDTVISKEPDGRLTTSVYRKPTHTDQHLAYASHHPRSTKRGIAKCLYDHAKQIVTKPSGISKEKKHLSSVLVCNGYPLSFLQKIINTRERNNMQRRAHDRVQNHRGPGNFAAAYNIKAYGLFSSRKAHYDHT